MLCYVVLLYIYVRYGAAGHFLRWKCWNKKKAQEQEERQHNVWAGVGIQHGRSESQISKPIYMESFLLHEAFANLYFAIVKFCVMCMLLYVPRYVKWFFIVCERVCACLCVCTHSEFSFVNAGKVLCFMVWRWQRSTVECTVNAVKMLNEINNSINIMSATSFDEKCKTLNMKPGWIFRYVCALCARAFMLLFMELNTLGDEFLNEPHISCRLVPLVLPFIPRANIPSTLYFTIPQLDPIQHLCLHWKMNKLPQSEWGNAQHTYTQSTMKWIRFSNWVIVKPASNGECFCMGRL